MCRLLINLNEEKIKKDGKYTVDELQGELQKIADSFEVLKDENGCFYSSRNNDNDINRIRTTIFRDARIFVNLMDMCVLRSA